MEGAPSPKRLSLDESISDSPARWLVLLLGVVTIFGPYYAFDLPSATQADLRQRFGSPPSLDINSTATMNTTFADFNVRYQMMYSLYSVPNIVMPTWARR